MSEREQLVSKINEMTAKVETMRSEICSLQEEYNEKYATKDNKDLYLNKYYKYKDNSYSCPQSKDDYWDTYYHVVDVISNQMLCVQFHKDSEGEVRIGKEFQFDSYIKHLTEITKEEYYEAFDRIIEYIDLLRISSN